MKTTNAQIFGGILRTPGGRRGSTLLIVIALLSLLVLMAATIAYTSKLEVLTTRNFGKAVQNQTSALTGVPFAAFAAKAKLPAGAVGTLDFTFDGKPLAGSKVNIDDEAGVKFERAVGAASQASAEEKTKWIIKRKSPGVGTTTGSVDIADAASRVNLNTADAQQLATIISLA
ncbi:hypothetical protein IT571_01470, partial [Candidatus Sumerlaeota bacterium]|nr:hypothetical protein [Candidatus Sumerlaeota bacterium]